jgi:predicted phosphohydrolase
LRVAALADLHGHLPEIPSCDVLLLAGDLCPLGMASVEHEARWLRGSFRRWLDAVPAREVVGIAGNHDFVFEHAPQLVPDDLRWTYLQDTGSLAGGLSAWGSPWTPWFHDWAFNAPAVGGEDFLRERYDAAPDGVDVLLLHGPPAGYGDRVTRGASVGAVAALELVERLRPRLCVFGHIHEGRGAWTHGVTRLINAAAVGTGYRPRRDPVVVVDV